jgi:hypothetical protein
MAIVLLSGWERAPSVDVLGSFFPVWMFCIGAGILLTLAVRFLLIRVKLDGEVGPRVIVYPGMVALFACAIWLGCFGY